MRECIDCQRPRYSLENKEIHEGPIVLTRGDNRDDVEQYNRRPVRKFQREEGDIDSRHSSLLSLKAAHNGGDLLISFPIHTSRPE